MKKAAAYIRVSTDEQAREGLSLDFQEQDIVKYCQNNNITLVKKYIDDGYSAKSLERPKWQEFEQEAHLYDYLIVWRLDRLSRNQLDTFHIIRNIIDRNGIKLICLDAENEDLETEQGMMMFTLKSMIAEAERRAISKRVSRAHEEKVKRGELLYPPPLGYKMVHGKAEIIEKDAETVRLAFQLVAENKKTLKDINIILMNKGYLGFNHSTQLHRIIKNRFYIGEVTRNKEWFKGIHEPIISEELFMLANSRFSKTSAKPKRASLFSGKVVCGVCGKKMVMQPSNKKVGGKIVLRRFARCQSQRTMRECSNKLKAQTTISRFLIASLQQFVLENATTEKIESVIITRDFEKELQAIENQRMKVLNLYARDLMPDHLLDKKLEVLSKQEAEIFDSQKEYADSLITTTQEEKLAAAKELLELAGNDFADVDRSRELLDVLIERIIVTFDEVDFFWK